MHKSTGSIGSSSSNRFAVGSLQFRQTQLSYGGPGMDCNDARTSSSNTLS